MLAASSNMAERNRAKFAQRSTSPRPTIKNIPLPTVPNVSTKLNHHSSSDNLTSQVSVEEEPIYDVPPCFANNWDSSQTLPRPSTLNMGCEDSLNSRTSTISSLSTINSCTSVATLTAEGQYLEGFPVEHYQRSPGAKSNAPVEPSSSNWYPESPSEYSKNETTGSVGDKRKRSKSKNRSLLLRSGSVLKSMFSSSNDDVGTGKSSSKRSDTLTVDVNQSFCNMQGRLLLKELTKTCFNEVNSETLASFDMVPFSSVTIFTSHSQLNVQKSHNAHLNADGVLLDLIGSKCEALTGNSANPKKSRDQKHRSLSGSAFYGFKLQLLRENSVVRVFQTDSKDSMNQWVTCLQSISQMTPNSSFQSVSQAPASPLHGTTLAPLENYHMSRCIRYVPAVVVECCERIEQLGGFDVTGIYRVPGNSVLINSILNQISPSLIELDLKEMDVHTIASALKTFLRRLPEPLITADWYSSLIVANRKREQSERLEQMRMVLRQLPVSNWETLKYLMGHLARVAEHSDQNKMDVTNLATVFGPTLLRSPSSPESLPGPSSKGSNPKDDMIAIWGDMLEQRSIIEGIISNQTWLFSSPANGEALQHVPHALPDVVQDTGFGSQKRRDSDVSLNSLTSAAQMHLNCTTSAVRKMATDKLAAGFGSHSRKSSSKGSSASPSSKDSADVHREVSPIPRRSKSMSDKADKLKQKEKRRENQGEAREGNESGHVDESSSNSSISLSYSSGGETNYFQSQRMLKDLDSLIESLKAECKDKDDKVRRSAEEGQAIFDGFCKLFNEGKERKPPKDPAPLLETKEKAPSFSGSGDLEHLIARELDAKIANLRLEYAFKVETVPSKELRSSKSSLAYERALSDSSAVAEKAQVETFIENPSYDVEKKHHNGHQKVELRRSRDDRKSPSECSQSKRVDRVVNYDDRYASVYENVVDGLTDDEGKPFPLSPNVPSNVFLESTSQLSPSNRDQKPQSQVHVPNTSTQHQFAFQDNANKANRQPSPRSLNNADQMLTENGRHPVKSQSKTNESSDFMSGVLMRNVTAPFRSVSKSRNKNDDRIPSHLQSQSKAPSLTSSFPYTAGNVVDGSSAVPNSSRSNRESLNSAHLVHMDSARNVNVAQPSSASSGTAIDRSASRTWVTRSNPDLLTAAAKANLRSTGTPTQKNPAPTSSSHGTPVAKQLVVFHTSQV